MSARHLKAIAIGVAVLLALWGASELMRRGSSTTAAPLPLPPLPPVQVDTVAITHGADTVLLVKQDPSHWTVNRFAASSTSVADLFQAFGDSAKAELAAQSASSFARMGVDSGNARVIRLVSGGKTLAEMFVGGPGPGYDASYVRLAGDARVFLWRNRVPTLVARPVADWREHRIGGVVPDSVSAVAIQRAGKQYALRKQGTTWTFATGAAADSSAVARFLERLRNVNASGFATEQQADSLRLARPVRRLSIGGTGDRPLLSLAFDSTATGFWVRGPGGTTYRLDIWQVDQLTPTVKELSH